MTEVEVDAKLVASGRLTLSHPKRVFRRGGELRTTANWFQSKITLKIRPCCDRHLDMMGRVLCQSSASQCAGLNLASVKEGGRRGGFWSQE